MKPFAESSQQNRKPIFNIIEPLFRDCRSVFEVGSGTGQHAVYFAGDLPHLVWHTSDVRENHAGIREWIEASGLTNVREPLELDTLQSDWPEIKVDAVFSANTLHIMHWDEVVAFFAGVGRLLNPGGKFVVYGPFNYNGNFTSDSNARFDQWLKGRDSESGIKDFDALDDLARQAGMQLVEDFDMPANNRMLYWRKI
jgi:cyclopropane fatty-acyl-phospholipid synthase-like methyltransferase